MAVTTVICSTPVTSSHHPSDISHHPSSIIVRQAPVPNCPDDFGHYPTIKHVFEMLDSTCVNPIPPKIEKNNNDD